MADAGDSVNDLDRRGPFYGVSDADFNLLRDDMITFGRCVAHVGDDGVRKRIPPDQWPEKLFA